MNINDVLMSSEEIAVALTDLMLRGYIEFLDEERYIVTPKGAQRAWLLLKRFKPSDRVLVFEGLASIIDDEDSDGKN